VQADADANTRRAELAQRDRQRNEFGQVGVLAVAPLLREHATLTQILDQLSWNPFAFFGFRGPLDDVAAQHLVE
jgi:hypothetical protein